MAITKLTKHDKHRVSIHKCKETSVHYAALRCVECDKHIQWLSEKDFFCLSEGTHINNNNNIITTNNYLKYLSPEVANEFNSMSLRDSLGKPIEEGEPLDSGASRKLREVAL